MKQSFIDETLLDFFFKIDNMSNQDMSNFRRSEQKKQNFTFTAVNYKY